MIKKQDQKKMMKKEKKKQDQHHRTTQSEKKTMKSPARQLSQHFPALGNPSLWRTRMIHWSEP